MDEISQPIVEKKASELILRSKPCKPGKEQNISSLTILERALLFAELSMIAYLAPDQTKKAARRLGFTKTIYYDNDGSQAYSFSNGEDIVIAFRGTEPNEWNDIKADMDATKAIAETVGKVHRGFKKEVDDIWPQLEEMLAASKKTLDKKLWFTGHSLGGAMASICA